MFKTLSNLIRLSTRGLGSSYKRFFLSSERAKRYFKEILFLCRCVCTRGTFIFQAFPFPLFCKDISEQWNDLFSKKIFLLFVVFMLHSGLLCSHRRIFFLK